MSPDDPSLPKTSSETSSAMKEESPHRVRGVWIVLGIVVILCVAFAPLVYAAVSAGGHIQSAKTTLEAAYAQMSRRQFSNARSSLQTAHAELEAARASAKFIGPWGSLPWFSVQTQALDHALEAGSVGLDAANELLQAMSRIQEAFDSVTNLSPEPDVTLASPRSFQDLSREEKRVILARLDQSLPQIRVAREKALIALSAWERIPQDRMLPPVRRAMEPLTQALQSFRERSEAAVDLAGFFLPLVGYPQAKTYVVLLQNADELRPTGGFIGTVGTVRLDSGEVTDQEFQDVYAFDRTASSTQLGPPPEPLRRELGVTSWFLRDSNWSPDAPQSAMRIMRLFEEQGWLAQSVSSVHVTVPDGVIFLQPELFTSLLRLTGPLTVEGITFTPEGFFDELQYAVEVGFAKQGLPVEARKQIMSKVGNALFARLSALPTREWVNIFDIAMQSLTRKDIMLVMRDQNLQKAFDARHWSGRAQASTQDELWVVDANLAALKTDGVMDKQVYYQIDMTNPAGPLAAVTLKYTNKNRTINWRYTRYRDYVRIFVPEGSELVSSEGAMLKDLNQTGGRVVPGQVDVMKDLGKTVFGAFWAIEPGETRTLRFTYRLPTRVTDPLFSGGEYKLLAQKQPGAKHRLTLDLRLGKKLVGAAPPEAASEYGDDRYRVTTIIDQDKVFEVKVK